MAYPHDRQMYGYQYLGHPSPFDVGLPPAPETYACVLSRAFRSAGLAVGAATVEQPRQPPSGQPAHARVAEEAIHDEPTAAIEQIEQARRVISAPKRQRPADEYADTGGPRPRPLTWEARR